MSTQPLEVKIGVRVRIEKLHKMEKALQREIVQMRVLEVAVEKLADAV